MEFIREIMAPLLLVIACGSLGLALTKLGARRWFRISAGVVAPLAILAYAFHPVSPAGIAILSVIALLQFERAVQLSRRVQAR